MCYFGCDICLILFFFFFSSRRRHTRLQGDWSSDVCSSDLNALADACGGASIGTDGFVDKDRNADTYVDHIVLDKLAAALNQLRREHPVVFVEGICLRDTLRSLNVTPQAFVYCKRISQAGLWADDLENYLEKGSLRSDLSWVDQQSVVYHARARPLENADLVYARHEE